MAAATISATYFLLIAKQLDSKGSEVATSNPFFDGLTGKTQSAVIADRSVETWHCYVSKLKIIEILPWLIANC